MYSAPIRRNVAVNVHGRYLVTPPTSGRTPEGLLVGFHGYAQNAETMMDDLRRIPGAEDWGLLSAQGLHRFYSRKARGQVVANWMTSEERDLAIADNLAFVRAILDDLAQAPPKGFGCNFDPRRRLVFVGFSQGVAMAYRAASIGPCAGLISLGGDLPPEFASPEPLTRPNANGSPPENNFHGQSALFPPVLLGRGLSDPYYAEKTMLEDRERLERMGVAVEPFLFDGGHEWSESFNQAVGAFLKRLAR